MDNSPMDNSPMDNSVTDNSVVIVGGGPAGLATAACLQRRGMRVQILDAGSEVGQSWARRYDRLHLHTPRVQSQLPGLPIPRSMGRWVSRDDVVRYLQSYATWHRLRIQQGTRVERIDRPADGADGYVLRTDRGDLSARSVVLATGYNHQPRLPDWPGIGSFSGELLHAADYRTGAAFRGRDILVVGIGNTGSEIAADLAEQGAGSVRISVRTPPNIIPRQVGPIPCTLLGIGNDMLPPGLVDPINRRMQRRVIGDLTAYGLPPARHGVSAQMRRTGVVPTIDVGLIEQLRSGRVTVVSEVTALDGDQVVLKNGERIEPEVVIAATGYARGLQSMVGGLGVLDGDRPRVRGAKTDPAAPDLYFVGLANRQKGLLLQINLDARAVARAISRRQGARPPDPSRRSPGSGRGTTSGSQPTS